MSIRGGDGCSELTTALSGRIAVIANSSARAQAGDLSRWLRE